MFESSNISRLCKSFDVCEPEIYACADESRARSYGRRTVRASRSRRAAEDSLLTVDLVGLLCLLAVLFFAIGVGAELWALSPSISSGWKVTLQGGGAVAILLGVALGVAAWSYWQVFRDFTF